MTTNKTAAISQKILNFIAEDLMFLHQMILLNSSLTYTKRADRVTQNQEKIKEDDSPIINEFISIDETIFL